MKRITFTVSTILIVAMITGGSLVWVHSHQPVDSPTPTQMPASNTPAKKPAAMPKPPAFNKRQLSIKDPASTWVIVNKQRPLTPKEYVPADLVVPTVPLRVPGNQTMQLRKVTAMALQQLFADATRADYQLMLSSGYRSYTYQVSLYNGYVKTEGRAVADTQSARPGYSEHQTGLAADVEPASRHCEVDQCFGGTPEGKWLAANAYKYGFIVRYPKDKEAVTGYEYEPWHVRYVGVALATEMHKQGATTLEEFFNLPSAPDY